MLPQWVEDATSSGRAADQKPDALSILSCGRLNGHLFDARHTACSICGISLHQTLESTWLSRIESLIAKEKDLGTPASARFVFRRRVVATEDERTAC
jgi:hypothetical protein